MTHYIGNRLHILQRFGKLPSFSKKIVKNPRKESDVKKKIKVIKSGLIENIKKDYTNELLINKKISFIYGVRKKQLKFYEKRTKSFALFLRLLEFRLDCVVYRCGFAPTIAFARQIINHRHILVNNKVVNIPSFICKIGDFVSLKTKSNLFQATKNEIKNDIQSLKSLVKKELPYSVRKRYRSNKFFTEYYQQTLKANKQKIVNFVRPKYCLFSYNKF